MQFWLFRQLRFFSHLKLNLSPYWSSMSSNIIDDILLINLNMSKLYKNNKIIKIKIVSCKKNFQLKIKTFGPRTDEFSVFHNNY